MCGRFILDSKPELIEFYFELDSPVPEFHASYNIPPNSHVPIIWQLPGDGRSSSIMHWGLIPHWAKTTTSKYKMINARAESLNDKPAYRDAYKKRRCLVPTNGFYEWHATAEAKQPYFIGKQDKSLFALAGLWEYWEGEQTINSFTIITTVANKLVSKIHERMPVIIDKENFSEWLDPENQDTQQLNNLLVPGDIDDLEMYAVSTEVNSPRHDTGDLLKPKRTDLFQ